VQRVANRIRVNAQLIDARTDAHLWAQTYDRDLADVFAIQSEIAKTIADQLQAKISPGEKAAIAQPPTTDLTANALYTQAIALENKEPEEPNLREGVRLLDEAVVHDPHFLLAYCALARMHLILFFGGYDYTPARRELANAATQMRFVSSPMPAKPTWLWPVMPITVSAITTARVPSSTSLEARFQTMSTFFTSPL